VKRNQHKHSGRDHISVLYVINQSVISQSYVIIVSSSAFVLEGFVYSYKLGVMWAFNTCVHATLTFYLFKKY
jgi:hypothetical protein